MLDGILSRVSEIYAYVFFGTVIVIALAEAAAPRRRPGDTLALRWFGNVVIWILDAIVLRAIFPMGTIAWAALCHQHGWGLLPAVGWSVWSEMLVTLLALDCMNYGQHYLLHRVPALWRLHRTHHSDAEYDFTTGLRFHPVETLFTSSLQFLAIFLLGASPLAVFAVQIIFLAISFIEHANLRIPRRLDAMLRLLFVTPDMHRIHHSQAAGESQSNFSNLFSWWDRLFGTYIEEPSAGHDGLVFGLAEFTERKHATLPWMLVQPFLADGSGGSKPFELDRPSEPARQPRPAR